MLFRIYSCYTVTLSLLNERLHSKITISEFQSANNPEVDRNGDCIGYEDDAMSKNSRHY